MDKIKIIWRNLYSKYRTNPTEYNLAIINSLIFKSSTKADINSIKRHFKEMSISSNFEEYFKKYSYKDSILKLQLLGYLYDNNFKPPPNYLSFDYNIYSIMFRLLKEKQNLIDRNIYLNLLLKFKKEKNKIDCRISENNNNNFLKNFSRLSYSSFSNKNQSYDNKYINEITNSKNNTKIITFSYGYNKSKYDELNKKEIKDNSTKSIEKLIEKINYNRINKNKNIINSTNNPKNMHRNIYQYQYSNSKTERKKLLNKKLLMVKKKKKVFSSGQLFYDQDKVIELIKNLKKERDKANLFILDRFKEKWMNNKKNKIREYINNYWKTNKNFITNLIEKKNIINYNCENKYFSKRYYSPSNISEISKSNNYSNYYSNSFRKYLSSRSLTTKHISLRKYKLSKQTNNLSQNSLINKIQNDSDFMKNKNYSVVLPKENKSVENIPYRKNIPKKNINFNYREKYNKRKFPIQIMEPYSSIKYKQF